MRLKKMFSILFLMLIGLLIAACDEQSPIVPLIKQEYTATFIVGGEIYHSQTLQEGATPDEVTPSSEEYIFRYWTDDSGIQVDPQQNPLASDVTYIAVCYPVLSEHVPFLFTDAENKLHPEADLTPAALRMALHALASEQALAYFPQLPTGGSVVTTAILRETLLSFFAESNVNLAMGDMEDRPLTRADLAVILCRLQYRIGETVSVPEETQLPADLYADTEQIAALLEASLPHTCANDGINWEAYALPTGWETGFVLKEGWLYYVNESGYLLRDDKIGLLTFGSDGRFTSGDEELDQTVAGILKELSDKNPEKDRLELLYEAHVYCRDSFKYLRRNAYGFGATGWEIEDAKTMFSKGRGNCYNYAATFWALARGLGYEARAVSGTCTSTDQPHGWVFINFDGKDYIFDCEWEMAYRTEREIYDKSMYMIPSNKWSYWNYKWVK